eukprot:1325192-Alexandrium_andersonii.AAC.1
MSASLVGSEMCIRDRPPPRRGGAQSCKSGSVECGPTVVAAAHWTAADACLLYTSDAADDM